MFLKVISPVFQKADIAHLRRISVERYQASLSSMLKSRSQSRDIMKYYLGIDVAPEKCAVFIVDDAGAILFEGSYATEFDEIF